MARSSGPYLLQLLLLFLHKMKSLLINRLKDPVNLLHLQAFHKHLLPYSLHFRLLLDIDNILSQPPRIFGSILRGYIIYWDVGKGFFYLPNCTFLNYPIVHFYITINILSIVFYQSFYN